MFMIASSRTPVFPDPVGAATTIAELVETTSSNTLDCKKLKYGLSSKIALYGSGKRATLLRCNVSIEFPLP